LLTQLVEYIYRDIILSFVRFIRSRCLKYRMYDLLPNVALFLVYLDEFGPGRSGSHQRLTSNLKTKARETSAW
jgi:hypothetical protein